LPALHATVVSFVISFHFVLPGRLHQEHQEYINNDKEAATATTAATSTTPG